MLTLRREEFEEQIRSKRPELLAEFTEADSQGGKPLFLSDGTTLLSLALRPEQKLIWITGVLGSGLNWMFELQRIGLLDGYEWIGFKVKADLPWGKAIARFSKAKLMTSTPGGDEYCASLRAR